MDYTKFPHQTSIPPSMEGERQARFLDTLGTPYLHRRNVDGSVSRKAGGRLYVTPAQQASAQQSTFLSLGMVGDDRRVDALRAYQLQGNFDPRGVLAGDGGLTGGTTASTGDIPRRLLQFARGWGATQSLIDSGGVVGADGNYVTRTIAVDKTRNGADFERTLEYQVWTNLAAGVDGSPMWLPTCPPTVLADGTQLTAGFGFVGPRGDNTSEFFYLHGRGDAITTVRPVPDPLPDTPGYKRAFIPFVTSPAGRVAFAYTESYPATVTGNYSGLMMVFGSDGGLTWSPPLYPQGLFDEGEGPRESGSWAGIVEAIPRFVVPITRTRSIGCTVAYHRSGWLGGSNPWCRIKLIEIDTAARTVTGKAVLAEGPALGYHDYIGTAIPIAGGVLFTLKTPWRSGTPLLPQPFDLAVECWFTADGSDAVHKGTMPWTAGQTGPIFAIDKNTVGCAVFADFEGYSVYASRDLGATWERWASIDIDADLFVEDGVARLNDFESVIQLPGNPAPGAPWITDARVPAPN